MGTLSVMVYTCLLGSTSEKKIRQGLSISWGKLTVHADNHAFPTTHIISFSFIRGASLSCLLAAKESLSLSLSLSLFLSCILFPFLCYHFPFASFFLTFSFHLLQYTAVDASLVDHEHCSIQAVTVLSSASVSFAKVCICNEYHSEQFIHANFISIDSMGLCHTEEQASSIQRNSEIDRQLERDRGRREKEYKILLLGEIHPHLFLWLLHLLTYNHHYC